MTVFLYFIHIISIFLLKSIMLNFFLPLILINFIINRENHDFFYVKRFYHFLLF